MRWVAIVLIVCLASGCRENPFLIHQAKKSIREQMRDPDAVKFRDVIYIRDQRTGDKVCVEVNTKNGYGAYIGFQWFVWYAPTNYQKEQLYWDGKTMPPRTSPAVDYVRRWCHGSSRKL